MPDPCLISVVAQRQSYSCAGDTVDASDAARVREHEH